MAVKRFNGSTWDTYAGATNLSATQSQWKKTAAGGETTLSGSDDSLITLAYTVGQEAVYVNGVLMVRGSDYTATDGSSVVLTSPLVANNVVQVISAVAYAVANVIPGTTITTKGDLVTGSAIGTPTRLPIGVNNSFLIADATQATGLRWATNAGQMTQWRKAAVGGETSISGTDDFSMTLSYTAGLEMVYVNGVLLQRGVDYTASNGTSVTGLTALVAGDVVTVIATGTFNIVNAVLNSGSSTITGNIVTTADSTFNTIKVGLGAGSVANNTGIGVNALVTNTTGGANTAVGNQALQYNTNGGANTAIGNVALSVNTTGSSNTAVGNAVMQYNISGTENTAGGWIAMANNVSGNYNTALGSQALFYNTTGNQNVAIGHTSLNKNTTGQANVAIGDGALYANTTGNVNTAIGFQALAASTATVSATAVGGYALAANTTGAYTVAVGYNALASNTIGTGNTAVGYNALSATVTNLNNTAVGDGALAFTKGDSNTAVGRVALYSNTTGTVNTAVGFAAMQLNTVGIQNTAVGSYALNANTIGNYNTSIGDTTLYGTTTGVQNTAVGQGAGLSNTTGSNNTMLGYNAQAATATVSNTITLGNSSIATLRCQVTSITALSDARDKKDIVDLPVGLDLVNKLRPVKFTWNMRPGKDTEGNDIPGGKVDILDSGFIAQDLMAAEDDAEVADFLQLTYRDNPDMLEASAGRLIPVLVKAIQELSAEVEALKKAGE